MTIGDKKQLFRKLKELQKVADEVWVPIDAERQPKSKVVDRISLIVGAMAANAGLLADLFEEEVLADENRWRMDQEFKRIYNEEINRLKPPELPRDISEDKDDYDAGGIAPGS